MNRRIIITVLAASAVVCGTAVASTPTTPGTWRALPAAPIAPEGIPTAVWTGTRLLVFGSDQHTALDAHGHPYATGSANVAASYDPASRTWRKLSPPKGTGAVSPYAVWTGRRMLVWGPFNAVSYDPAANRWRHLPPAPTTRGFAVWTGRELIGWGGGCCGDAFTDGSAYKPTTNHWRRLPHSPLAGSQHPLAAWTGSELIVLVGDRNPDTGKPWPARLARAAAYDPAANRWRRIAPLPAKLWGETATWDGRELLVTGGGAYGAQRFTTTAYAYDPGANRWRRLASMPAPRGGTAGVWNGKRLVLVGGYTTASKPALRALAYDPGANRWSMLPRAPLPAKLQPLAVAAGSSLLVWGSAPTAVWGHDRSAGAAFTSKAGS
jgi:hypothetical protein